MSNVGVNVGFDNSQAVSGVNQLVAAFGNLASSGITTFASLEGLGSGLEDVGNKVLGAIGAVVQSASQIQTLQAQLTQTTYNFSASLGQNETASKAMTQQLMTMATAMKMPTASVLSLANTVASFGYSGQQIPTVTKAFAEFAAITQQNALTLAPTLNKVMQQLHIPVGQVTNFTSALFAAFKETSGGASGIANMTDRLGTLASTTGFTAQEFIALAADAQNVDARIGRGGAASALNYIAEAANNAFSDPLVAKSQNFFKFMGVQGPKSINDLRTAWQQNPFGTIDDFLKRFAASGGRGNQVNAQTLLNNMGLSSAAVAQGLSELAGTTQGSKTLQSYLQTANEGWQSGADVQTAYQATLQTTAANMIGLRDTITQLSTKLSADLLPAMTEGAHIAQTLAGALGIIPAPVLAAVAGFTAFTGVLAVAAGLVTRVATATGALQRGIGRAGTILGGPPGTPPIVAPSGGAERAVTATETTTTAAATTQASAAVVHENEVISENTVSKEANVAATQQLAAAEAELGAETGAVVTEWGIFNTEIDATEAAFAQATAEAAALSAAIQVEGEAAATAAAENDAVRSSSVGMTAGLGAAGIAVAGLGVAFSVMAALSSNAEKSGKSAANSFSKGFDTSSVDGLNAAIDKTQSKIDQLKKSGEGASFFGAIATSLSHFTDFSKSPLDYEKAGAQVKALEANVKNYQATMQGALIVSQRVFGDTSGDHLNQVLQTATQNAINLGNGGKQAQQSLEQLLQTNVTNQQAQVLQNSQQALDAYGQAALNLGSDQQAVVQSSEQITEATTNVTAAELGETQARIQLIQATIQLQNYQAELVNAQNKVAEAQTAVTASSLATQQAMIQEGEAARQLSLFQLEVASDSAKISDAQQQQAAAGISLFEAQLTATIAVREQYMGLAQATVAYAQSQIQARQAANSLADANWNLYKLGADYAIQYKQALNSVADSTLSLKSAQITAANAQWQLTYLQGEGASRRDIMMAQLALAQANQQVTDTQTNLSAAQLQANQMPTDHALAMADAETQLAAAQQQTRSAALQEQAAQLALYRTEALYGANVGPRQAAIALQEAYNKLRESGLTVAQAQVTLNNLQDGMAQLQLAQATLAVQQSQQKEKDAAFQVITAQEQLNLLQAGTIQLQYQQAVLAVTQSQDRYRAAVIQAMSAQLAYNNAVLKLRADQSTLNGVQLTAFQQAEMLGRILASSTDPAMQNLGRQILNALGPFEKLNSQTTGLASGTANVSGAAYDASQNLSTYIQQVDHAAASVYALNVQQEGYLAAAGQLQATEKAAHFAQGGYVTRPTLAVVAESAPELILPLNDMVRTQQLLQQAGLINRVGDPYTITGPPVLTTIHTANAAATSHSSTTTNNYYLNAITQPADPQEIVDAFAWHNSITVR